MDMIDSHCHLDFPDFDGDRGVLLGKCREQGIHGFVIPSVEARHWQRVIDCVDENDGMYGALGLHPMFMSSHSSADLVTLERLLGEWEPVAIGEIGLDFYQQNEDMLDQQVLFEAQLHLAKQFDLPVILHVRKAHDQVLATLRRIGVKGGIVHAFSGSEQQARAYLKLGFVLGVGGALTYPRAERLGNMLAHLPLESLVLESDAPDMPPVNGRGIRNSPLVLLSVVEILADLFNTTVELVAQQTASNARRVLALPEAGAGLCEG